MEKYKIMMVSAVCLMFLQVAVHAEVALQVSPSGKDNADGSEKNPLLTLEAAARRAHVLAQTASKPVIIHIRGGLYLMPQPLVISAELSGTAQAPIIFQAADGETAILTGAEQLSNLHWEEAGNGRWKTAVPAGTTADRLLLNGEGQTLARYPNAKPDVTMGGVLKSSEIEAQALTWPDGCIGAYIHGMHKMEWGSAHSVVTGLGAAGTNLVTEGGWQVSQRPGHGDKVFIENALGALDVPGEWYLDAKSNVLWIIPPTGVSLSTARIDIIRTSSLVRVVGGQEKAAHDIVFRGLHFKHTARTFMDTKEQLLRSDWCVARQGALFIENAERVSVEGCSFENLGGNAVFISKHARKVDLRGSTFRNLGASCVCVAGDPASVREPQFWKDQKNWIRDSDMKDLTPGPKGDAYPAECVIADNLMTSFGELEKQSAGVMISMSERITVEHNTIGNAPRAGICVCDGTFGGHLITGNDVFDTVLETGDHGPFNSWGRDRHWIGSAKNGPHVKERAKLDNYLPIVIDHNRFAHSVGFSWGIDLDDGSSNYVLTRNLGLNCSFKLREGYFRTVENNIFITGNAPGKHCCYDKNEDVIRRNIIVNIASGKAQHMISCKPSEAKEIDYNLYFNTVGMPAYIELQSSKENIPPISLGEWKTMTLGEWQKAGFDTHSVFVDPKFIDPANDDYRVSDDSPALKLGFKNFPTTDFGTRSPLLKGEAKALRQLRDKAHSGIVNKLKNIGKTVKQKASSEITVLWRGATLKQLTGMPLLSAVGLSTEEGAFVSNVAAGSPADKAGVEIGDVILQADGRKIITVGEMKTVVGQKAKLDLWRGQKPMTVSVAE